MSESSSTKLGIQACTLLFISLFIRGTHHSFIITEEKSLVKNQLVAILYKLPKEYQLSFEFKPIEFLNVWGIIAHLTIGGDMTNYGDRTPSIMISPERYLVVTSAINGFVNYFKICTEINIPLNEWTSIKVSQQMIETKYIFTIEVSGQQIFTIENTDAREFDHVKVYMSDPWDTVQPGYIRNLEISNVVAEKNCSLTSFMFSTSFNDEIRVRGNILTTPICLINLQNIIIFLRHEPGLSFKGITWHGLNVTSIDEEERFTMIYLKEFFAGSYFYFEARFYVAFNQIPGGKEKFSVAVDISWFEYFLQQQVSKVNKQLFLSRLKSPETPDNKAHAISKTETQEKS